MKTLDQDGVDKSQFGVRDINPDKFNLKVRVSLNVERVIRDAGLVWEDTKT